MNSYFGSDKHRQSAKNAAKLGTLRLQAIVNDRINVYQLSPNKCQQCGIDLSYEHRHNKFCSKSCAAQYNNSRRAPMSDETKNKIRKSVVGNLPWNKGMAKKIIRTCLVCGNDFEVERIQFPTGSRLSKAKCCSGECGNTLMRQKVQAKAKEKVANGTHKGWQSRNKLSYPEQFFDAVFKSKGLNGQYTINHPVNKRSELGLNDDSNYFLDFYFARPKIDLEVDGKQHMYPDRVLSDNIRDEALTKAGYRIYRIKWRNVSTKKGKENIINEINNFIQNILGSSAAG